MPLVIFICVLLQKFKLSAFPSVLLLKHTFIFLPIIELIIYLIKYGIIKKLF